MNNAARWKKVLPVIEILKLFKLDCEELKSEHQEFDLIKNYESYTRDVNELLLKTAEQIQNLVDTAFNEGCSHEAQIQNQYR